MSLLLAVLEGSGRFPDGFPEAVVLPPPVQKRSGRFPEGFLISHDLGPLRNVAFYKVWSFFARNAMFYIAFAGPGETPKSGLRRKLSPSYSSYKDSHEDFLKDFL